MMEDDRLERFDKAVKIALDGGFRTQKQAEMWAVDYLTLGGTSNHEKACDSANIKEAERVMLDLNKEVDFERCCALQQKLYLVDAAHAEIACKNNPGSIYELEEKNIQLDVAVKMNQFHMSDRTHFLTPQEAEVEARRDLELPAKLFASGSSAGLDIYGKSAQEVAEIANDMELKNSGKIPSLHGKSRAQIAQEAADL